MNPALLRHGPGQTLQTHPNTRIMIFAAPDMRLVNSGAGKIDPSDRAPEPIGPLAAVLMSTGPSTSGKVTCGGWAFEMKPDEEQIACAVEPKALLQAAALELRVSLLTIDDASRHAPSASQPIAVRGSGSRLTDWRLLQGPPPSTSYTDGHRALGLRLDEQGQLVMDWAHTIKEAMVFCEMDELEQQWRKHGGPEPFIRTILARGKGAGSNWYQAKETTFETT